MSSRSSPKFSRARKTRKLLALQPGTRGAFMPLIFDACDASLVLAPPPRPLRPKKFAIVLGAHIASKRGGSHMTQILVTCISPPVGNICVDFLPRAYSEHATGAGNRRGHDKAFVRNLDVTPRATVISTTTTNNTATSTTSQPTTPPT